MSSQNLQIISTLLGFIGTAIMFFNGYSLLPYHGGTFADHDTAEKNRIVRKKNKRMAVMQKLGMGALTISFLIQTISYFIQ